MRTATAVLALAVALGGSGAGEGSPAVERKVATFVPNVHPILLVERVQGSIHVDGDLTDPGWRGAALASGFAEFEPGDGTRPAVETRAYMTYDADHLFIAFACEDTTAVRATLCERDGMRGNDVVGVQLDTYGSGDWGYEFMVNPHGVQADWLWSRAGGWDMGYNLAWESAGRITDSGYQVEIAIPFASLRFPDRQRQTWRVNLTRIRPRESWFQYGWAAYDRDDPCQPCQWGTVSGIANVRPGKGIEFLPALIGFQKGALIDHESAVSTFAVDDPEGEVSLAGRYNLTSSISAEVVLNPDFSQVEGDIDQIDLNTTTALFYPEKRHFFQEGSDLFWTRLGSFYSRSINDPEVAAKVISRVGRTSIAYLVARDVRSPLILPFRDGSAHVLAGRSTANALRVKRRAGSDSEVGGMITDHRLDSGGSGTALSCDGDIRLRTDLRLRWQAVGTRTAEAEDAGLAAQVAGLVGAGLVEPTFDEGSHTACFDGESFWGHAFDVELERRSRHLNVSLGYVERSPTYRVHLGYDPRNDQRSATARTTRTFFFERAILERLEPRTEVGRQWAFSGEKTREWLELGLFAKLKALAELDLAFEAWQESFRGVPFTSLWYMHASFYTNPVELMGLRVSIDHGRDIARLQDPPVLGRQTDALLNVYLKPVDRIVLRPRLQYTRSRDVNTGSELFEGYIVHTQMTCQFTRALGSRVEVQYNDVHKTWDADVLLTYQVNPFSVVYLGTTHDWLRFDGDEHVKGRTRLSSRQVFFKMQYLVRY